MESPSFSAPETYDVSRSFFDKTIHYSWDMDLGLETSVDRSFDPVRVEGYLSRLEGPDRSFIRELLDKTTYTRYTEFKQILMRSFDMFVREIGKKDFYIILPTHRIGSEHWLTALLWPQLRTMNIKEIISEESDLPAGIPLDILIIDDAIYTGISTYGKIDEITYKLERKIGLKSKREEIAVRGDEFSEESLEQGLLRRKEASKWVTFHIATPFVSAVGEKFLMDEFNLMGVRSIVYKIHSMPRLRDLMDIPYEGTPEKINEILHAKFGIASSWEDQQLIIDTPAAYFDHKVASDVSTFSSIYLKGRLPDGSDYGSLFKVDPSRIKIEELEQLCLNIHKPE